MSLNSKSPCGLVGGFHLGGDLKNPFSVYQNYVVVETNKTPVILDRHVHERFCNDFGKITITVPSNGYAYFSSAKNILHAWIAENFLGPRMAETVDHINRIKTDNRLANLRWATQSTQNENRGNVRSVENAIPLPEIAPGFTTRDLPKYISYRQASVEKTGATRGEFFSIERKGDIRKKTDSRKELTLLDKYYQAIAIAHKENILCYADDMDISGTKLRDEAISLFKNHIKQGGTSHPITSPPEEIVSLRVTASSSIAQASSSKRKRDSVAPSIVKLESSGELFHVYKKCGTNIIYDEKFGQMVMSVGDWSVERKEGTSVNVRQAIRTNKKATLKGDLCDMFPEMQEWPSDKISLQDFIWHFCMKKDLPENCAVGSLNHIPGDFREANLHPIKKTNDRVPRVVIYQPPPGIDIPNGIMPLYLGVAYKPLSASNSDHQDEDINRELSYFTIAGTILKVNEGSSSSWKGSSSVNLSPVQKYDQAISKLKDAYHVKDRDFDNEYAEYTKLIIENRNIVEAFELYSNASP